MNTPRWNCVFLGLSITSAWGNGHATTYRGLVKELAQRGHSVTFLERDVPWYSAHREFDSLPYCNVELYSSLEDLDRRFEQQVKTADLVVVGSFVPEGIAVGHWVNATARGLAAFYDIDTPVTLANLKAGHCEYLAKDLVPAYDLYLSFTGGPLLRWIERELGSPCARPLYCSVDPGLYYREPQAIRWDLGYLGTYAPDRQPALDRLLCEVAAACPSRSFVVAGPLYPDSVHFPKNVERIEYLPAAGHRAFYNAQRFTLNLTRQDMVRAGYSPSVRLFEAAACGVPILTDEWPGLDKFYRPHRDLIPIRNTQDVIHQLQTLTDEKRAKISQNAQARTMRLHTAARRAQELEEYVLERLDAVSRTRINPVIVCEQVPVTK